MSLSKKQKRPLSTSSNGSPSSSGTTSLGAVPSTTFQSQGVLAARQKDNKVTAVGTQALSKIIGEWSDIEQLFRIEDVIIGGRTPSPFTATMGAHSTAWVAHIDMIRRHLIGFDLQEAIGYFITMAESELKSPLLNAKDLLEDSHKSKLDQASGDLVSEIAVLKKDSTEALDENNYHTPLQHLRGAINKYLTYVNYLPLSTVAGGDPAGHGEGVARGVLNFFEYAVSVKHLAHGEIKTGQRIEQFKALEPEQLKAEGFLEGLDDGLKELLTESSATTSTDKYKTLIRETLWQMFAPETPGIFAAGSDSKEAIWALSLDNFLRTVRFAYPYAYDFCQMNEPDLLKRDLKTAFWNYTIGIDIEKVVSLLNGGTVGKSELSIEAAAVNHDAIGLSDIVQGGSHLQTTVLLNDKNSIGDIVFQGRTKSPFSGTMGAHTTAWVVHLDAVKQSLIDQSLPDAIYKLQDMAQESFDSDLLEYSGIIDEKQQVSLVLAYNELKRLIDTSVTSMSVGNQIHHLEACIVAYLNFLNVTPMATIEIGGIPGGRREGEHRKFLQNYELCGDKVFGDGDARFINKEGKITAHLIGLFDGHGLKHFPPEPDDMMPNVAAYVNGYDSTHFLAGKIGNHASKATDKKQYALQQFINSIAEAYPKSYENSNILAEIERKFGVKVQDAVDYKAAKAARQTAQPSLKKKKSNGWSF